MEEELHPEHLIDVIDSYSTIAILSMKSFTMNANGSLLVHFGLSFTSLMSFHWEFILVWFLMLATVLDYWAIILL